LIGITNKYNGGQGNLFWSVEDESDGVRGTCGFINYKITLNTENLKGPESSKVREKCRSLTRIAHPFSNQYPFLI
jgi:hypothetical protein